MMDKDTWLNALAIGGGVLVIIVVCYLVYQDCSSNPDKYSTPVPQTGYNWLSGIEVVAVNGHEYLKSNKGGITHSESCACRKELR